MLTTWIEAPLRGRLGQPMRAGMWGTVVVGTHPEQAKDPRDDQRHTVWLEATFEHCWLNILNSKRVRPLARNKAETFALFEERRKVYCLADWHFIVRPDLNSYEVARQIAEEIFCVSPD